MSGENLLQARVAFADEIRSKASIRSASLIDGLARADALFRDAGSDVDGALDLTSL
ncbi:MAG TPA: hypothetical protein VHW95_10845 [Steroidobacteraceae bacterium]|nr:hypothetical protein [Steroidobacteraceae bacterium]